ncbi:MAG: tyrosine-type recombinase/integrase [Fimbriimonas sp.]|nr:tyrosine-type recombinase/integrase [Fimbriimonas sp.]
MNTSLPVLATFAGHLSPAHDEPRRKSPHEAAEEFFTAKISNENTRESYIRDAKQFASWCAGKGYALDAITAVHVARYRDQLVKEKRRPATIKRQLSALRMLFSHMVATGAMSHNPAREVKTDPIRRTEGKTPALQPEQMHQLFASIGNKKPIDLRDRALIGVMAYTFARASAACQLMREDYIDLGRETMIRLKEKGGVEREIPCHPVLARDLDAWIEFAKIDKGVALFQTFTGQAHNRLSGRAMNRDEALQMVKRRLDRAGLPSLFSCHSFRATGITTFLENGGSLETAQNIAGHADSRTTKGYDRRETRLELSEIMRVAY